jgi:hypothetical protein
MTSEIICESDPRRGAESDQEKIARMYNHQIAIRELTKERLEQELYSQYTYQPQINKISKVLAPNRSIDDLAYNRRGQE